MKKYVFDTNAFNRLLDDVTPISHVKDKVCIYGTHIQLSEIKATKRDCRRNKLIDIFNAFTDQCLQTESMVFPITFGASKFGDGTYEELKKLLDNEAAQLTGKKKTNKLKNNHNDAQIGEVALKNGYTLVTDDPELLSIMSKKNGKAHNFDKFIEDLNEA